MSAYFFVAELSLTVNVQRLKFATCKEIATGENIKIPDCGVNRSISKMKPRQAFGYVNSSEHITQYYNIM